MILFLEKIVISNYHEIIITEILINKFILFYNSTHNILNKNFYNDINDFLISYCNL